jgi:acetyl-CoA carboxylase biotin carboxyl carrier protein
MDQEAFEHVAALLRLFRERRLRELAVEEAEFKLRLRRAQSSKNPIPVSPAAQKAEVKEMPKRGKQGRTVAVRSPLIGVFYRAAAPDAPAFVDVGDTVSEGQTVCIIEAMKVFNEIKAEWRGRVVAIPAENGALVQAGDPLVVLEFLTEEAAEEA